MKALMPWPWLSLQASHGQVILDCKPENVALYEKCGYRSVDVHMRLDLPK